MGSPRQIIITPDQPLQCDAAEQNAQMHTQTFITPHQPVQCDAAEQNVQMQQADLGAQNRPGSVAQ